MALIEDVSRDVSRLADDIRQASAEIKTEITTFPSGAVSLDVRESERVFVLDYFPSQAMFGVDELDGDGGFNSGYRFGFKDFESARAKLLQLMKETSVVSAAVPGSLPVALTSK
jgi:hypothetical protein